MNPFTLSLPLLLVLTPIGSSCVSEQSKKEFSALADKMNVLSEKNKILEEEKDVSEKRNNHLVHAAPPFPTC